MNPEMVGSVRLYTRSGALVTLPVTEKKLNYQLIHDNVEAMLSAGFTVNAPGLEAGELREQIGWVVRGTQERDNRETPYLMLYSNNMAQKFSFLKVYLNTPEEIEDFENASGLRLHNMQSYVGKDKPSRGESKQLDKFFYAVPKKFSVVYLDNPKYDEAEAAAAKAANKVYKEPKRKFIRWDGTNAKTQDATSEQPQQEAPRQEAPRQEAPRQEAPRQEAPKTQQAAPQKSAQGEPPPKDGAELITRMQKFEQGLVAQKLCRAGDLFTRMGVWSRTANVGGRQLASIPMDEWGDDAIAEAVKQIRKIATEMNQAVKKSA